MYYTHTFIYTYIYIYIHKELLKPVLGAGQHRASFRWRGDGRLQLTYASDRRYARSVWKVVMFYKKKLNHSNF